MATAPVSGQTPMIVKVNTTAKEPVETPDKYQALAAPRGEFSAKVSVHAREGIHFRDDTVYMRPADALLYNLKLSGARRLGAQVTLEAPSSDSVKTADRPTDQHLRKVAGKLWGKLLGEGQIYKFKGHDFLYDESVPEDAQKEVLASAGFAYLSVRELDPSASADRRVWASLGVLEGLGVKPLGAFR